MFKKFIMRKMVQSQTKNMPKDQQEMILTMVEKDPQLFQKIAKEIQAEVKKGKTQMSAAMTVMPKYKAELQALMGQPKK